ncbi:argininosuccinate lyase [bacterium]|nr:argininosuccinate lyase [bacterium]
MPPKANKTKKMWSGVFSKESNPLLEKFNESLSFDKRLYAEDIEGSIAHSKMLAKIGLLTAAEAKSIQQGLAQVKKEIEAGKFEFSIKLEDIHMAIETRLTQIIGDTGKKLHTARSRNDQVALDIRLYSIKNLKGISTKLTALQKALVALAEKEGFCPMPGYTHLQRAQPIYFAHHLLAYVEMLARDKSRVTDTLKRIVSPLGSGALAGSPFKLDREFVARELGLNGVTQNSLDGVSDRDFACEILFNIALLMTHLSRFAEELILWCSQEFSFVKLPQEFCTGSSMMPQKVNPDAAELIRGKTGRAYGNLISLLTTLKGLPLAYNKDMQEDKEPLFDSLDTIHMVLDVLTAMVPGIKANKETMKKATEEGFLLATDVADYLAAKGLPFREAHEVSGKLVQHCIAAKTTLEKLPLSELKKFSKLFGNDIGDFLDIEKSIDRRNVTGGPAKNQVQAQIKRLKKELR